MEVIQTEFQGLYIIEPSIFRDDRGLFYESYNRDKILQHIPKLDLQQDNISVSKKNVLRGLHFQNPPYAQAKLVTVLNGSVLDVVVDLRANEPTYGKSYSIELTSQNRRQLFIPRGFAHAFLALEDDTTFSYKVDNRYDKNSEMTISWNDPSLNINWPSSKPILSEKDLEDTVDFSNFKSPFS